MSGLDKWVVGLAILADVEGMQGVWLIRRVTGANITIAKIDTAEVRVESEGQLERYLSNGSIRFVSEERHSGEVVFQDLPEKYQLEISRKYAYVKAFEASDDQHRSSKKLSKLIKAVAEKINDDNPPAWNTLNTWIANYICAGNKIKGLYPSHYKKGRRSKRLDHRVYAIIGKVMKSHFHKRQPLVSSSYKSVEAKILKHNLDNPEDLIVVPSYSTVAYYIKQKSFEDNIRGRIGKKRARYEFSDVGKAPTTERILERVEADHTPLDIHVLHDETRTLLGRPTLTVLIDHYSRMVLGFQISFEEPSYASAAMAIVCAILPKEDLLSHHDISGSWPAHGVMETLVADNGTEFWSGNLDVAISEVGSVLQYSPVRSPNYKGVVERFFLTLKTMLIDSLPGKTNGVGSGSDEYIAAKEAKLTLSEFKKIFLNWLVNVYHLEPRGKAEQSPLDLWWDSYRSFPVAEEDTKYIETAFMCSGTRTLGRSGVQYASLEYNSDHLRDLYRRGGTAEYLIKYNPFDIGYIYLLDDINRVYIKVPCVDYQYAKGLSMYAHKAIRKRINSSRKNYKDSAVLQKAKMELFGELEELHERNIRRKSQTTTKKAARVHSVGVESVLPEAKPDDVGREIIDVTQPDEDLNDWEVW